MYFIHKYEVSEHCGGPEEGGWWYEIGTPDPSWRTMQFTNEETAYDMCRLFNGQENERRSGLTYGYHSVLSHREEFYSFDISEEPTPQAYPQERPHYE